VSEAEELSRALGARPFAVDGRRMAPMACAQDASAAQVLTRPEYLHEVKLDGVRIVADKRGDEVWLTYRKIRDASASYPEIVEAVRGLAEPRLVLDGEIVAFDEEGRPSFQLLGRRIQARGRDARSLAPTVPVVYVVFDLLAVGAFDLRPLSLEARKRVLERVFAAAAEDPRLKLHPTFEDGVELFRLCREKGLEGVISKRKGSRYRSGDDGREPPRTSDWIKVKCELESDLVVIGWTEGEGRRRSMGALDLGAYKGGRWVVAGSVGSGLDQDTIDLLLDRLAPLEVDAPVASGSYVRKRSRHHVRPEIVVSVRYMGVTAEGLLRHPVFRGIRSDVDPRECLRARGPSDDAVEAVSRRHFTLRISSARADEASLKRGVAIVSELLSACRLHAFSRGVAEGAVELLVPLIEAPLEAVHALALLVTRIAEDELRRRAVACKVEIPRRLSRPWVLSAREKGAATELSAAVSALEGMVR
jgi:bifunctional non-homologous end joining protein LigD